MDTPTKSIDAELCVTPKKPKKSIKKLFEEESPGGKDRGIKIEGVVLWMLLCICTNKIGKPHFQQYVKKNMPIYDGKCRHCGRKIQVKTTRTNKFNKKTKKIKVGSSRYSSFIYGLKGTSKKYKKLVPTFVCIHKDKTKSFIVIPNLKSTLNKKYYHFNEKSKTISWNEDMVRVKPYFS